MYSSTRRHVGVVAVCLLVANCSHPSDKALSDFSDSTTAITSLASSAATLEVDLDDKTQSVKHAVAYAKKVVGRIGPQGIDAATRVVGFFVSAMGMGLIFHGVVEALQTYGITAGH